MKRFDLKREDLLVVDDLKPGLDMAKSCEVDFACAGWSHIIPEIKDYMQNHSDYYLTEPTELNELVF